MIRTFTEDERMREQYRLREEFLRTQITNQAGMEGLRRENAQLVLSHKAALEAKEAALKAQEEMRKRSVLFMKKRGIPLSEIAVALGISQEEVERL